MALYIIGGVRCELHPFNIDNATDDSEMPFARHEILGGRTSHEKVAQHERKLRLQGKIFPRRIGGEAELALLESLHAAGDAVFVTRGNASLGWYRLIRISRNHQFVDERGIGRKVDLRIEMELSDRPGPASAAGMLTRLFGYA